MPVEIIEKFKSGFPKEWQELIQEHLYTRKHKVKTAASKHRTCLTSKKKGQLKIKKEHKKAKVSTENVRSKKKTEISMEKIYKIEDVTVERKPNVNKIRTTMSNGQKGESLHTETYKRTKTGWYIHKHFTFF